MNRVVWQIRKILGIEKDKQIWATCRGIDRDEIAQLRKTINERLVVHTDTHFQETPNLIIAVGSFDHHDYVRVFTVPSTDNFADFIEQLHRWFPDSKRGRFDMPGRIDEEAFYSRKEL